MRADLHAASRCLGLFPRVVLREPLARVPPLLADTETVQALAPVWWRGRQALAVVTNTRLLLVRRPLKCSTTSHAGFSFHRITHLTVHPAPPQGVHVRLLAGLDAEEFSLTHRSTELERALRAAIR